MKKTLLIVASLVAGYVAFLKVAEKVERDAKWHSVTDRVY